MVINSLIEVLKFCVFKTYCLFSKVPNMNTRQAVSPFESWHCWIEHWKSLKRQIGECTSWSKLILLEIFWILVNDVFLDKFLESCSYIVNDLGLGPCAWIWVNLELSCVWWYFHFWGIDLIDKWTICWIAITCLF